MPPKSKAIPESSPKTIEPQLTKPIETSKFFTIYNGMIEQRKIRLKEAQNDAFMRLSPFMGDNPGLPLNPTGLDFIEAIKRPAQAPVPIVLNPNFDEE